MFKKVPAHHWQNHAAPLFFCSDPPHQPAGLLLLHSILLRCVSTLLSQKKGKRNKQNYNWYQSFAHKLAPLLTEAFSPPAAVQLLAELPVVRHLAPAVPPPLASGHVDDKVAVFLVVENAWVIGGVCTCAGRERVDHSLRDEGCSSTDPGLIGVQVLLPEMLASPSLCHQPVINIRQHTRASCSLCSHSMCFCS